MSTLAFIPARSGSKGVINKNIKTLDGIPLLAYSVYIAQICKERKIIDDILVSTDSREYLSQLSNIDYHTDYLRPKELAGDASPTIDALVDALNFFREQDKYFDKVLILQPTSPFRTISQIKSAISLMINDPSCTCIASVFKLGDYHPMRIKKIAMNGYLDDFCAEYLEPEPSRRQDFSPKAFIRSGSIYLSRTKQILEEGLIKGKKVLPLEVSEVFSINVDEELDFFKAEAVINSGIYKNELKLFNELKTFYET